MDRFPKLAIFLRIALAIVPASSLSMQALANSWGVNSPQDGCWEEAAAQGENQNTWLLLKCDRAGIGLTIRDFWGTALGRVNGVRYPIRIIIRGSDGLGAEYYVGLRYDADEKEWNTDGCEMHRSFLDVFAKGASMHSTRR